MVSFLYRMPAGIPGAVTRVENLTAEAQAVLTSNPPLAYGVPIVIDTATGKARPVIAGDTAASLYGINIRPYPTGASQDPLGTSTPYTLDGSMSVAKRGYIQVHVNGTGSATKNGPVYVRVGNAGAGTPIGGIEASPDATPSNSLTWPNAYFVGPADANGMCEVALHI